MFQSVAKRAKGQNDVADWFLLPEVVLFSRLDPGPSLMGLSGLGWPS